MGGVMIKVAFHIQKGGTGKTTLAGNVSYALSKNKKTILIDCDPQGNASSWFLVENPPYELADVLKGDIKVETAIISIANNLYILPTFGIDGSLKQYGENQLNDEPFIFDDLSQELERNGFQVAIFDLSPGISRLEKCILLAMDEVITPLTPEYFSIDGIDIFNNELKKINKSFRREVKHQKIVCNCINRSFRRHKEFYKLFKELNYDLFTISQDSKLAESQINNQSIFEYYPESKTVIEIEKIAKSLIGV